ncbi:hypothetical protein LEN26_017824 [Aphanomyces euteiches]|nr:hypothetical protein LEN26_017824 [Aphanomyces euteiches]KAH9104276.1 hypothetical protein AeMF1_019598 [Aphanomyces euteiches]KAH9184745.1 hypothetical protein AeNC1_013275 [Aphanomyces euteiches]
MRHRASSGHGDGLLRNVLRRQYLQGFLVLCLIAVVLLYFEMFKLSSVLTTSSHPLANADKYHPSHRATLRTEREKEAQKTPSIAVLLTHYRDSEECAATLTSLFTNAQFPSALHLYVFEEVALDDYSLTCIQILCEHSRSLCEQHRAKRITFKRRHAADHVGPSPARRFVETMLPPSHGHEYYLSITTRLEFIPRWDTSLIAQWTSIGNPKAILSFAPPSVRVKSWPVDPSQQSILCTGRITSKDANIALVAFNHPVLIKESRGAVPRLVSQYSEDFHFGPVRALAAAPSDSKAEFVWEGLAYYRATRWWTRGYDFYSPSIDVVYERYTPRPTHPLQASPFAESMKSLHVLQERQRSSFYRIRRVLGFNPNEVPARQDAAFTVGTARTIEQWVKFSGVDPRAEFDASTDKQFKNCKALVRVPPPPTTTGTSDD